MIKVDYDLSSLRAENERLRKDNNYFHAGFDSVREDYEDQKARAEKAEDKLAEVTKLWSTAERDATHLYARMMKAEAYAEKLSRERNAAISAVEKAEALCFQGANKVNEKVLLSDGQYYPFK